MIVSEARIAANRRNAQKSTGPKTPEGKQKSRANALKHGLCSNIIVEEDRDALQERNRELFYALKPQNDYHNWLVDKAALVSLKVDRVERIERRLRDKAALRAELAWDDDRRLEAEILGGMLAKRPAETVETLRRTPHGCEWLMTRWAMLARVADVEKAWNDDQTSLAFDLLATPTVFRTGRKPGETLDFDGNLVEAADDPAAVARRAIAELKQQREIAADLDEVERALVEADLTHDLDPEMRRLRRYEGTLHRRFQWCVAQINHPSPYKAANPGLTPNWTAPPEPELKPEPPLPEELLAAKHSPLSPHPPFDLEPDEFPEPGQDADIPAILKSRKEKRQRRAEARREAKRRKLQGLRA
jgi:hypothetical protein